MNQTVIGKRTEQFDKLMQTALDTTLLCNCCDRHQYNKCAAWAPYGADVSLGVEEYGGPPGAKNGIGERQPTGLTGAGCKCNCRHLSRMICKLHPDSPEIKGELNNLAEQIAKTEFSVHGGARSSPSSVQCMEVIKDIGIIQQLGMAGVWG